MSVRSYEDDNESEYDGDSLINMKYVWLREEMRYDKDRICLTKMEMSMMKME
jgi:hypothetical protein